MKPPLSILNWPKGRYVPAIETDVSKTFERIRREMKAEAERRTVVTPIKRKS